MKYKNATQAFEMLFKEIMSYGEDFAATKPQIENTMKKPLTEIDPQKLRIGHDPVIKRAATVSKYDDIFRKLSHGQCIVCDSGHANSLANVLRTYISLS